MTKATFSYGPPNTLSPMKSPMRTTIRKLRSPYPLIHTRTRSFVPPRTVSVDSPLFLRAPSSVVCGWEVPLAAQDSSVGSVATQGACVRRLQNTATGRASLNARRGDTTARGSIPNPEGRLGLDCTVQATGHSVASPPPSPAGLNHALKARRRSARMCGCSPSTSVWRWRTSAHRPPTSVCCRSPRQILWVSHSPPLPTTTWAATDQVYRARLA